jgi:hypothetical protein
LHGDHIRAFGFACDDWLVRNCLVGVAGENSVDLLILRIRVHVESGPTIVSLTFNGEPEADVPIIHIVPLAPTNTRPPHPIVLSGGDESLFRTNRLPGPQCRREKNKVVSRRVSSDSVGPGRKDG